MSSVTQFDVVVFGGGMIGSTVALGFVQKGNTVAIVEPNIPEGLPAAGTPPDLRVSAISYGSQQLLYKLGAWAHIDKSRIQVYDELAVWEFAPFATEFSASDAQLTYLGHLMENRNLQLGLHTSLKEHSEKISWFKQGEMQDASRGTCVLDNGSGKQAVRAKLIVAADGGFSPLRRVCKMGETGWQYTQSVFAIGIRTETASLTKTYQQFSENGPMAYLPLFENYAALVWYTTPAHITQLKALSREQLKAEIEACFPPMHSDFEILDTASFPIRRNHANHYFKDKVVLCGDAAHTINPLAGQGVNIGFKDVEALIRIDVNKELSTQLERYESERRPENLMMMSAMDVFSHAFSNDNPILKLGRNLGLKLANHTGPLKQMALKKALGV